MVLYNMVLYNMVLYYIRGGTLGPRMGILFACS